MQAHASRRRDLVSRCVRSWAIAWHHGTVCLEQVVASSTELSVHVRVRELEDVEFSRRSVSCLGDGASRQHIHVSRRVRGWTVTLNTGTACLERLVMSSTEPSVRVRTIELEADEIGSRSVSCSWVHSPRRRGVVPCCGRSWTTAL